MLSDIVLLTVNALNPPSVEGNPLSQGLYQGVLQIVFQDGLNASWERWQSLFMCVRLRTRTAVFLRTNLSYNPSQCGHCEKSEDVFSSLSENLQSTV